MWVRVPPSVPRKSHKYIMRFYFLFTINIKYDKISMQKYLANVLFCKTIKTSEQKNEGGLSMSKPRKPDSKRPSKEKLKKIAKKKQEEERIQKEAYFSRPIVNSMVGREECRKRVEEGKACYCKERCQCRSCIEHNRRCIVDNCKNGFYRKKVGCTVGCIGCLECKPCY